MAQPFEPIDLDATHQDRPEEEEMVTLFKLDGEEYQVPASPRANFALQILAIARDKGEVIASAYALEEMLGVEGFEALQSYEELTADQLNAVIELAGKHALGDLDQDIMGKVKTRRKGRGGGGRG